jgi:sugar (pentulose or hexulose) kinase
MTAPRHIAVIDIGKTNAKLALVDRETLAEIDVRTTPNRVLPGPPYPHFDTEALWAFVLDGLTALHAAHRIDAIVPTTHGACAALLDKTGNLAAPVLDYEHDGPEASAAAYDALRPPFSETGSPRLALGLNLGAQLHWQLGTDPTLAGRLATVVTGPQYWSHRLTGVAATDMSSLGAHTDLWNPAARDFSSLVGRLGLAGRIAPPRRPGNTLGPVLPEIAAGTGLDPATPVACGIHDSNASLLPYLLTRKPPFAVVSTGTWVITMAVGGRPVALDEARDTLINVDAMGAPVPSARFMGGREYEMVHAGGARAGAEAIDATLGRNLMLLPAVEPLNGPFRGRAMQWTEPEAGISPDEREVALAFYLALMTAECLEITGAEGPVIVEGPFAGNRAFLQMLQAAVGRPVLAARSRTGTSAGAALLTGAPRAPAGATVAQELAEPLRQAMALYAGRWRQIARGPA